MHYILQKYELMALVCPGKSITISLSECKLCEQNNTTVKHNELSKTQRIT